MTMPQNVQGVSGHLLYRGTAPLFITTRMDAITSLAAQSLTGASPEHTMILRRFPKPHAMWADLVLMQFKDNVSPVPSLAFLT